MDKKVHFGIHLSAQTTFMKLLRREEIRAWDEYTINKKGISSAQLMEDASQVFSNWFLKINIDKSKIIHVICGAGNNGGDGLCVARILQSKGYLVETHLYLFSERQSIDNKLNQKKLAFLNIYHTPQLAKIEERDIIIDALLGSGIRGAVEGKYLALITAINALSNKVVSIDLPSGSNPDALTLGEFIHADHVLSFELPKISFFLEDHYPSIKSWDYRSIGLVKSFLDEVVTDNYFLDYEFIRSLVRQRSRIASKFSFGFGQLCGGSVGMYGAIILAARAALISGIGRLSVNLPGTYIGNFINAVPEAMACPPLHGNEIELQHFRALSDNINGFAVGPGLGTSQGSIKYIDEVLDTIKSKLILDADALNIIAREAWQEKIPPQTIITPHHKEFDRLFGKCKNQYERLNLQRKMAKELSIFIILKGGYTSIVSPSGDCYFNNTGNVGMATAGSGDVLTGMLLAFLSQGYTELNACLLAVNIHGRAGDLAALKYGVISMTASNIVEHISETLKNLHGT